MKDHVYKLTELTGTPAVSMEAAVTRAIRRAHMTIKKLSCFQVIETRGNIDQDRVRQWQVTINVGFAVEGRTISQ